MIKVVNCIRIITFLIVIRQAQEVQRHRLVNTVKVKLGLEENFRLKPYIIADL